MFSNGFFISFILTFTLALPIFSQNSAAESLTDSNENTDLFYICKRDRSIRWLRAYKLESGKCKAIYSKEGYLQVISSATYFSSCEGVLMSVKKNLEEGNFKCSQTPKVSVIELEVQ